MKNAFHWTIVVAAAVLGLSSTSSFGQYPSHNRDQGLVVGGLLGAVTGGIIGDNNDNAAAGAAIGTAVGALSGAMIGNNIDRDTAWRNAAQQQQWERQVSRAVSVQDVIALSRAKVSDSVIVTQITSNGVASRPQSAEIIMMSEAGVSPVVIQAMQTARLATARAVAAPVYRDRVIVEERYFVPRPYGPPVMYPWHPHYHHGPPHYAPGVHWGFSFSN
jgi:outer membrane lipoprotein SlyB